MGKGKRKTRLEKGGSGGAEFMGFGAFAVHSPEGTSASSPSGHSLKWSPVYTGSDQQFLGVLFKRISQKRDGVTKAKALQQLGDYFQDTQISKKEQATALSHLVFLFHSKLTYDDSAVARAAAVSALYHARRRLPKAWMSLVLQMYGEIYGMLWCSQGDSSVEVRTAAAQLFDGNNYDDIRKDATSRLYALLGYVTRILSYGRAKNMHEDLFVTVSNNNANNTSGLSTTERERLDERFDRIVSAALEGIKLFVQKFPETEDDDDWAYASLIPEPKLVWKTLTSSKASFRSKTYGVLGSLCQGGPSLVYNHANNPLPSLFPSVLAQEKETANVPLLLEVLLLYLNSNKDAVAGVVDRDALVSPLRKIFANAGYGAPLERWGPTVLPLLVSLPPATSETREKQPVALNLLQALWKEGTAASIGIADKLGIAAAVAESSFFFLWRREPEADVSQDIEFSHALHFAKLWIGALSVYLSPNNDFVVSSIARAPEKHLLDGIGSNLWSMGAALETRNDCILYRIREEFWTRLVPPILLQDGNEARFHRLLLRVAGMDKRQDQTTVQNKDSFLKPLVKRKFHQVLERYQLSSASVPDLESYRLLLTSLQFCGANQLFDASDEDTDDESSSLRDRFVMNDLLRWMVINVSSLSHNSDISREASAVDFEILRLCLEDVASPLKQKSLWGSVLRELVSAKPDLDRLMEGLVVIAEGGDANVDLVSSESFDCFATDVAIHAMELPTRLDMSRHESLRIGTEKFLRLCVGLDARVPRPLVGGKRIKDWVEFAAPLRPGKQVVDPTLPNPVLGTLLSLVSHSDTMSWDEKHHILIAAWREGGTQWEKEALDIASDEELRRSIAAATRKDLSSSLAGLVKTTKGSCQDSREIDSWSGKAFRVRKLVGTFSLKDAGLAEKMLWVDSTKSDTLYRCLTGVLERFEDTDEVASLLTASGCDLAVSILCAVSDAPSRVQYPGTRNVDENVHRILFLCGGKDGVGRGVVSEWCHLTLDKLKEGISAWEEAETAMRHISVLSELVACRFRSFKEEGLDNRVQPSEVVEGNFYQYATNAEMEDELEMAEVVKIHKDDFPRLYFTIRVHRGEGQLEKQTVAERLRKLSPVSKKALEVDSDEDRKEREAMAKRIITEIVKPNLESSNKSFHSELAAECLSIVISQIGIVGEGGFGTTRHETFQLVANLHRMAIEGLTQREFENAGSYLVLLSVALGLGTLTPPSRHSVSTMKMDTAASIMLLLDVLENEDQAALSRDFKAAACSWLTISLPHMQPAKQKERTVMMIFHILSATDEAETDTGDMRSALIGMRAMREIQRLDLVGKGLYGETETFSGLFQAFCMKWSSNLVWKTPFQSIVGGIEVSRPGSVREALKRSSDALFGVLNDPEKMWLAFRLLVMASLVEEPQHESDELDALSSSTQRHLDEWTRSVVVTEEADEIEDDVVISGQWLPQSLMVEVESWIGNDLDYEAEKVEEGAIQRMLVWLVFLQYIETAGIVDVRNRTALGTYTIMCGAVVNMLDMMLFYIPIGHRNYQTLSMTELLENEANATATSLATLVLFRTFEVFPSLSKKWWEEDCPRSVVAAVSQFVEAKVAPETLRRELSRMNKATNLGEMAISGSLVSREVTATYMQDECELSIAVSIPKDFPLHNIEVDGRKTLGIPEKRWKRWALQMRLMLNSHDSTLLDAFLYWKNNIDKEFEGVEPCPVCYSVLSVRTRELPNLRCKTCGNCFHANCLYKWFNSSGKSLCVLCQQPWDGTRI